MNYTFNWPVCHDQGHEIHIFEIFFTIARCDAMNAYC